LMLAMLVSWTIGAQAFPITFTSSRFETSAVALTGGVADAQFGSSPPSALPLITTASVFNATNFASGSGIGATGLLGAQAEASTASGGGSAVGTSEFIGTFVEARDL